MLRSEDRVGSETLFALHECFVITISNTLFKNLTGDHVVISIFGHSACEFLFPARFGSVCSLRVKQWFYILEIVVMAML